MSEFIALALDAMNLADLFFDILVVREEINQGASTGDEVVGHRREHGEEAVILGNEPDHFGSNGLQEFLRLPVSCVIEAGHYLTWHRIQSMAHRGC